MVKVVFFDFDGVILDSAHIKTEAFHELYLPYGTEIARQAKAYHLEHQGVSRYKKFEYIHNVFLKKDYSEHEGQALSQTFSDIIMDKILKCQFIEGILEFLTSLKENDIPSFILSATPQKELVDICRKRKISVYFSGIFGAPDTKITIGEKIIKDNHFHRDQILFIGDSISDLKAANHLKVGFFGRVDTHGSNPFPPEIETIGNFCEFTLK